MIHPYLKRSNRRAPVTVEVKPPPEVNEYVSINARKLRKAIQRLIDAACVCWEHECSPRGQQVWMKPDYDELEKAKENFEKLMAGSKEPIV